MQLYLVHHGDAVPANGDPQRPLSEDGRVRVERVARQAASRGAVPAVIWHSGKLRARQTADICRRACNPAADFSAARGLQPTDPPERMADQLAAEAATDPARDVMLVGHLPHVHRLLCLLLEGTSEGVISFPPHGIVALDHTDARWVERWRVDG